MSKGAIQSDVRALQSRSFVGGSDARIIMGGDEGVLIRLWREKRGEAEPEDLSGNLILQLGVATEELNRAWFERNAGRQVRDVQRRVKHSAHSLDGGKPRRHCGRNRGRVRGKVHAALVILRGGGGRKVHATAPAQHGSPTYRARCSQSSPAAANGWRSQFPWTHFTSVFWCQPKRSSSAASNPGSRPI
jgi:hypothetical protein